MELFSSGEFPLWSLREGVRHAHFRFMLDVAAGIGDSRAHGKAGRARCTSTRSTLRLFHTYMYGQRPQREIPHVRKCPYKECV